MSKLMMIISFILIIFSTSYIFFIIGRNEGYKIGYEIGYEDGNRSGFSSGKNVGYKEGYKIGYEIGNITGYKEGYKIGEEEGYKQGKNEGYEIGNKTGYSKGYEAGLNDGRKIGYSEGYFAGLNDSIPHKYKLRDPTYYELIDFISKDKTDLNPYKGENFEYVCMDYSIDVCKNAKNISLDCHIVEIIFKDADGSHVIVGFNTIDRGWVFIEPQSDTIVKVAEGIRYYRDNNFAVPQNVRDDTIVRIKITP